MASTLIEDRSIDRSAGTSDVFTCDHSYMGGEGKLGLYDGFEGFRTPTTGDYRRVFESGLVVLDANVLLSLYRYSSQAANDLMLAMKGLGDRLWIPHQAMLEFWSNRTVRLESPSHATKRLEDKLSKALSQTLDDITHWGKEIALSRNDVDTVRVPLQRGFVEAQKKALLLSSQEREGPTVDTNQDPVLRALEGILTGRVGRPFPQDRVPEIEGEAARRIEERIPPGFMDKGKERNQYGDYFVWLQMLEEASRRDCDVLFVTRDEKEDWWRKDSGMIQGPRLELADEMRAVCGGILLFATPERFLARARELLKVAISEESLENVRYVQDADKAIFDSELSDSERSVLERLDEDDSRSTIELLPEGRAGSYVETIVDMARLAMDQPSHDDFLDRFQDEFSGITNRNEARRRSRLLSKLGFADWRFGRVELTESGQELVSTGDPLLIQSAFLQNIRGAAELKEILSRRDLRRVRSLIRQGAIDQITATQGLTILRWLDQLELLGADSKW